MLFPNVPPLVLLIPHYHPLVGHVGSPSQVISWWYGQTTTCLTMEHHILVGGFNPSEKYEFVSWDDYSRLFPIYGKIIQSCSKAPTSIGDSPIFTYILPIKSGDFPSDNDWLETTVFVHVFFSPVPPGGDTSLKAQSLRAARFYLARSSILEEGGSKKHKETCMQYNTYILPMGHVFSYVFCPPPVPIYMFGEASLENQFLSTLDMALTFFLSGSISIIQLVENSEYPISSFPSCQLTSIPLTTLGSGVRVMASLDLHFFSFLGT